MSEDTPEAPIEDFSEGLGEAEAFNLHSAMPGVTRALQFMRKTHLAVLEDLPLNADDDVRTVRSQLRAIDELQRDLDQFAHTGEKEVGDRIKQRVGRPGRR